MTFKADVDKIKESMREDDALKRCVIVSWKHKAGPEITAICTMTEDALPFFEKALVKANDFAALTASIKT